MKGPTTVLLTGAAGRIGSSLRTSLPALGWTLRCFDREPADGIVAGDVTSPADLDPVDDAEVHAAALSHADLPPSDAFVGGGFTSPGFGIDEVKAR